MKKLLIKVYRDILGRGQFNRDLAKDLRKRSQPYEAEVNDGIANAYYQCAAWLEETEEINPSK